MSEQKNQAPAVFTIVYRLLVLGLLGFCALQLSIIVNEVRWIHDSQSTIESRSLRRSVDPSWTPRYMQDGPDVEPGIEGRRLR